MACVSPSRIALALLTASVWPLSCCCEEPECGDDVRDAGELCFEADRVGVDLQLDTPLALRIGRFDGDELPDLLVVGTDTTGVTGRLLPGGREALADPDVVTVFGCSAYPIAGDLSGDGRDDLVFATCANGLLVFIAAGDDFAAPVELPVGVPVRQAAITDVDALMLVATPLAERDFAAVSALALPGVTVSAGAILSALRIILTGASLTRVRHPAGGQRLQAGGPQRPDRTVDRGCGGLRPASPRHAGVPAAPQVRTSVEASAPAARGARCAASAT